MTPEGAEVEKTGAAATLQPMQDVGAGWRRRAATSIWVAITVGLVACAADPGARRTRRVMSEEDEIKLGAEAAQQVEQYLGFSGSAELNEYVDRIGQRLVPHSSRSHLTHEFHVVDMKEPNAFALPGGHIYISRGLLSIMNSEDELAAVLGHEIGHVAGRHSAKQQTKSRGWIPLQVLAGIGTNSEQRNFEVLADISRGSDNVICHFHEEGDTHTE